MADEEIKIVSADVQIEDKVDDKKSEAASTEKPVVEVEKRSDLIQDVEAEKISLTIKSSKDTKIITVEKDASIQQLREQASKVFNSKTEETCLISSGKVLKDTETFASANIQDGNTLHMVVKTAPPTGESAIPFGMSTFFGIPGSPNFLEVQQQMQKQLLDNPQLLEQVMANPFVQSMIENPEYMRQIIASNPQMRDLMQQSPELSDVMSNPEVLRNTMEYARNPVLMQELIQSQVESNAQTPRGVPANPPPPVNHAGAAGMQSIVEQLMQNPQLVQEMFSAPYMNSMMEALAANPNVASEVMVNNPVFSNNPTLQDSVRQNLPLLVRQMQMPEMRQFLSNPQALSAMLNIQQGLDQLQQAVPNVFNSFPGSFPQFQAQSATQQPSADESPDTFSLFMRNMVNAMAQGNNAESPPEERYKNQLDQMQLMGFTNKQANLQALIATFGDIDSAVESILATSSP